MKKKVLIISVIALIFSVLSVSYTFAANNIQDGIRNVVGDAENTVEGAGSAIGSTVQNGVNKLGDGVRDVGSMTKNTMTSNNNGYIPDDRYTAARTDTTIDTTTASSSTMYTWVIIGVTAVGIGVLLWSYFTQNNKNDMYIDSDE